MKGFITEELYGKLKMEVKDNELLNSLKVVESSKMEKIENYYNSINTDLKLTNRDLPSPKYIGNKVSEILYKTKSLKDLENLSKSLSDYLTEEIIKNHNGYIRANNKKEIDLVIPNYLDSVGKIVKFRDKSGLMRYGLVYSFSFNNKASRSKWVDGKKEENIEYYKNNFNLFAYVVIIDKKETDNTLTAVTCGNYEVISDKAYKDHINYLELK